MSRLILSCCCLCLSNLGICQSTSRDTIFKLTTEHLELVEFSFGVVRGIQNKDSTITVMLLHLNMDSLSVLDKIEDIKIELDSKGVPHRDNAFVVVKTLYHGNNSKQLIELSLPYGEASNSTSYWFQFEKFDGDYFLSNFNVDVPVDLYKVLEGFQK